MATYNDPFMLNTNLGWDGSGPIIDQLKGKSFNVDGRTEGATDFQAEQVVATIKEWWYTSQGGEQTPDKVDDLNLHDDYHQDVIVVPAGVGGATTGADGFLDYTVGTTGYTLTTTTGEVLTYADIGQRLAIRVLDTDTGRRVLFDFNAPFLAQLNDKASIAKITFDRNATQTVYAGYYRENFDDAYSPRCFTAGTRIATPGGLRPVECLHPGDLVLTLDNGPQPVRWIGTSPVTADQLRANDKLRPIRFAAHSLAPGLPCRDLTVSRQHRILVTSKIAERVSGAAEILVPAKDFLGLPGVCILTPEECPGLTYYHLLLERHEVLIAEEVPSESFFLGAQATALLTPEEMAEVARYFPQLEDIGMPDMGPARQFVRGGQARRIVARHMLNAKPFVRSSRLPEPSHSASVKT